MPDEKTIPRTRRRRKGYYPCDGAGQARPATVPKPVAAERPAMAGPTSIAEDGTSIAADHVDVSRAAVGRVDSSELSVHQGAVGAARADRIQIGQGALGAALAGEVEVERGYVRTVIAREVSMEQTFARSVVAGEVAARQSIVGLLLARRVEGDVRVLLDWRGALAFGAAMGIVTGLVSRTRRARGRG
jgi:hypothetical protein